MKITIVFLIGIIFFAVGMATAQVDEYSSEVVLSNGTKVVGKITENIPGEQVTVQTRSGSTYVFKSTEIQSISGYKKKGVSQPSKSIDDTKVNTQEIVAPAGDSTATTIKRKSEPKMVREQTTDRTVTKPSYQYTYDPVDTLNVRINIEGGYSYRMAKLDENIPSDFKDYVNKLKSGFNIAANISYFFSEEYGVSLGYSRFMTSNSMGGVYIYDPISMTTRGPGIMEDDIAISFFGIGMAGRKIFSDGDILLIGNFSLGVASYNNDAKLLDDSYLIEGSTFAYTGLLSLDFMLSSNWALGFGISYLGGTLKDAKVNGESANLGEENLFRLDFNIGVKYYF